MTKHDKANRLLVLRKVRILNSDESSVMACVDGDHGQYAVSEWMEDGEMMRECSCPYSNFHPIARCSHLIAVETVWQPEREGKQ